MCTPSIAMGAMLIGGVLEGIGGFSTSMNNAAQYDMQAAGYERDIAAETETSAYEIARTQDEVDRGAGRQRAGFAANGIALSGSAADVLHETAIEGALDVEAIRWNSDVKIGNLKYAQKVAKYNAKTERAAAPLRFISPVIGGIAKFPTFGAPTGATG